MYMYTSGSQWNHITVVAPFSWISLIPFSHEFTNLNKLLKTVLIN